MKTKDFYPYELISETPDFLAFELTKGRKIHLIIAFRVIPVVILFI